MRSYVLGDNAYVVLDGPLDLFNREEIVGALPDPSGLVSGVINIARATYIDSTIMGMLVGFRRKMLENGADPEALVIMLPHEGPVRRAFEMSGMNRLFSVAYIDTKTAEERMKRPVIGIT